MLIIRRFLFCSLMLASLNVHALSLFWTNFSVGLSFALQQSALMTLRQDPVLPGDVVGRDFNYPNLGWFGHLGLWDGGRVVEVINATPNAVNFTDITTFKNTSSYWGTASARIPDSNVYGCFGTVCTNYWLTPYGQVEMVSSRLAIAKRAYQIYLIGANYTPTAYYVSAWAGDGYYLPRRGQYRCDTFVIDVLWSSMYGSSLGYYYSMNPDLIWLDRWKKMAFGDISPRAIFDALSSYQ